MESSESADVVGHSKIIDGVSPASSAADVPKDASSESAQKEVVIQKPVSTLQQVSALESTPPSSRAKPGKATPKDDEQTNNATGETSSNEVSTRSIKEYGDIKKARKTAVSASTISAGNNNNGAATLQMTPDVQKNPPKSPNSKDSKRQRRDPAVYLEELLWDLSCLELVRNENAAVPFEPIHLRRLLNREISTVRSQLSKIESASPSDHPQAPPQKQQPRFQTYPSPSVRRLTVFPADYIVAPANSVSQMMESMLHPSSHRPAWHSDYITNDASAILSGNGRIPHMSTGQPMMVPNVLGQFTMRQKIYIPAHPTYNFIGRILGPRGNSVRRLEAMTGCNVLIRGKGSVKDKNREAKLRTMAGWEHLKDDLHVQITAVEQNEQLCALKLRRAVAAVQRLLEPQFDDYKRQQLIQLAIINGTYRV